jgi:hypothetical protein
MKKLITILGICVLLAGVVAGCYYDPVIEVTIVNGTNEVVFLQHIEIAKQLQPNEEYKYGKMAEEVRIGAITEKGEILLDHTYTIQELKKIGNRVIIPPKADSANSTTE